MVTNRTALSTIGDGQLNSNRSLNSSTPLANKQTTTYIRQTTDDFKSMFSLTPSKHKRKRFPDMVTKSFSIEKSGTYYNSKRSPAMAKSISFAEYNTTSDTSPTLRLKSSTSAFKNDKAGLAATKLKLRLQFALYKVQQNKPISTSTTACTNTITATTTTATVPKNNDKLAQLNFLNPILSPSASKREHQLHHQITKYIQPRPCHHYSPHQNLKLTTPNQLMLICNQEQEFPLYRQQHRCQMLLKAKPKREIKN